jgi:hypothetical protein
MNALEGGVESAIAFFGVVAPHFASLATEHTKAQQEASAIWSELIVKVPPRKVPVRLRILAICSSSPHPLSLDEIEREAVTATAHMSPKYLRHVVKHHSDLVQYPGNRWGVAGRQYPQRV